MGYISDSPNIRSAYEPANYLYNNLFHLYIIRLFKVCINNLKLIILLLG